MKIEGTFQSMDPEQTGVSKAGNSWRKTWFEIITNEGVRSHRVAFSAFGDRAVEMVKAVARGTTVEVSFNADSRDYTDKNGQKRYDTELQCYGLAVITKQSLQPQYTPAQPVAPQWQPGQTAQPYAYPTPPTGQVAPPTRQTQPLTGAQPQQQPPYTPAASPEQLPPQNMGFPY